MSWHTMTTVAPRLWMPRTMPITFSHSRKSSPVVGSSSTSTGGSSTATEASARSWRAPRFRRNGSSSGAKPNSPMIASTRASAFASAIPSALKPNSSSSRTVGQQICRSGFWKRKPTRRASSLVLSAVVGAPSMTTSPASGFNRPFIRRIAVDLPAPFVPTNATNSPSPMVKLTPFRMGSERS